MQATWPMAAKRKSKMQVVPFSDKKHLFFDLDHTLWDFDKNAEETLTELFDIYKFRELGFASADVFIESYTRNNQLLWAQYHLGAIDKAHLRKARFSNTFEELGVEAHLFPKQFEEDYIQMCPLKTHLFPNAIETLNYLQEKYVLHLISNGFKEASAMKVEKTGIAKYFFQIVISENVGVHKPHPRIFEYAVNAAGTTKEESVMIGDSLEADVRGAQGFGMDAIFFNPKKIDTPPDVKYEISELSELTRLF